MNELRVEKEDVHVSVYMVNSSVLRGWVFLSAYAPHRLGIETIQDLMTEHDPMFPLRDKAGRFVLVGRSGVSAVEVDKRRIVRTPATVEIPVQLEMIGGHRFGGNFLIEHGLGDRVSDVLNGADPWLRVDTGVSQVWVRTDAVLVARPEKAKQLH